MKPYKILFIAAFALLATGCLDEDPKGRREEADAYKTASDIELNCVATLYNYIGGTSDSQGLQGQYRGVYDWNSMTTDEQMLPTRGGDWYDGGFWRRLYLHTWTASDEALNDTWIYLYKVITLCNRSLYNIEANSSVLTSDEYTSFTSEVRALRAIFYWYTMDMFGNIPLVTSYSGSVEAPRQTSRDSVYRWIISELEEVEPNLVEVKSNKENEMYGRVTAPVVWFTLAKLALNYEVYSAPVGGTSSFTPVFTVDGVSLPPLKAVRAYTEKLTGFGYVLDDDPATPFSVLNEESDENIWTIPMDKTLYANKFKYLFRSRHYNHGAALGMDAENGTVATLSTVETFGYGTSDVDSRWALDFYYDTVYVDGNVVTLDDGSPLVYYPLEVNLDLTGSEYEKTGGARMSKYEIDRNAYSDGQLQNNDIVLFRYADMLLMGAEACLKDGDTTLAQICLDEVRTRAGMGSITVTLDNILDERLRELMWEGWRRNDLIRFGKFSEAYDQRPQAPGESDGHTTVFPIPDGQLDLNTNLRQNPGY